MNLRAYEDEVNKLRKDNLSLRLRIYLLEERHGLLPKARKVVMNEQGCESSFESGTQFSSSSKKWAELQELQFL